MPYLSVMKMLIAKTTSAEKSKYLLKYLLIDNLLSNKLREMPEAKLSNLLMDIQDRLLKEEPRVSQAQNQEATEV